MMSIKLPELQKKLNFKDVNSKAMLEHAYILNNTINFDCDLYVKTALTLAKEYNAGIDVIVSTLIYKYVKLSGMNYDTVKNLFSEDVAKNVLVLKDFDDSLVLSSEEKDKFIKSITINVKATIIKLVERLVLLKQISPKVDSLVIDSINQFDIPVCKALGVYILKNAFEDECAKYYPNYKDMQIVREKIKSESKGAIKIAKNRLKMIRKENNPKEQLFLNNIDFQVNVRSITEIHDKVIELAEQIKMLKHKANIEKLGFCSIKCLVDSKQDCYMALYFIHQFLYQAGSFVDYLNMNLDNEYHAIHTKVFVKSMSTACLVDVRICTKEMDLINNYGIISNWKIEKNLQSRLYSNYAFYKKLLDIVNEDDLATKFLNMTNNIDDFKSLKKLKDSI